MPVSSASSVSISTAASTVSRARKRSASPRLQLNGMSYGLSPSHRTAQLSLLG